MNYKLFRITEISGWFCQHQLSSAKEEAWKVKEEGDQLEQILIKNRSRCFMAFSFVLPSSDFFAKETMIEGKSCREMLVIFMNRIIRLFVLVFFFNHVYFHKINSKKLSQEAGTRRRGKGGRSLPAEVGTGKECLLGERQCQTARRTFEVATAKGTPSLVETHPAWSWWAESRIKIVELWKSLVLI